MPQSYSSSTYVAEGESVVCWRVSTTAARSTSEPPSTARLLRQLGRRLRARPQRWPGVGQIRGVCFTDPNGPDLVRRFDLRQRHRLVRIHVAPRRAVARGGDHDLRRRVRIGNHRPVVGAVVGCRILGGKPLRGRWQARAGPSGTRRGRGEQCLPELPASRADAARIDRLQQRTARAVAVDRDGERRARGRLALARQQVAIGGRRPHRPPRTKRAPRRSQLRDRARCRPRRYRVQRADSSCTPRSPGNRRARRRPRAPQDRAASLRLAHGTNYADNCK